MARGMNMLVLMVFLGAAIQSSSAQTTHVVGDSLGWVVPPGGAIAYSTWAANETFIVGDTLVFNFTTGMDDVAKVTKAAYDSCNSTSPISRLTNGPASITLDQSGEHFFISTFNRRCSLGQKLAINVSTASAPGPAPTATPTPPAASAPAPATTPTRSPVTYTVGDGVGWNVLVNTTQAYELWAANKTFIVGDVLVFNFINGTQNVAEVTKSAFDSCNTTSTISVYTVPPVRITLATPGEHFYTSTYPNRCSLGQKLAINVAASAPTPAPTATPTPPAASAPAPVTTPTRSPVTYTVGDGVGWNVLVNTTQAYELWAANKTFIVGDVLVFNFINGTQNVAEVTKSAFDSCNTTSTISVYTVPPVRITLATPGEHFYTSTYPNRCSLGQKLAINVEASAPTPAPTATPTPPAASAPAPVTTPTRSPLTYTVGDGVGWNVLVNTTQAYELWAANKSFMVGDILVFNFVNGTQNVAEVTKSAFDSCNTTSTISVYTVPPVRITLATAGEHFYTSTYPNRCSLGQKLAINVTGSSTATPSPSPAATPSTSPTTSPSSPTAPSPTGSTPPPTPGNSAASLSVTGLFSGMLSIAVVLLY